MPIVLKITIKDQGKKSDKVDVKLERSEQANTSDAERKTAINVNNAISSVFKELEKIQESKKSQND